MIPIGDDIPGERFPVITILLILANTALFLFTLMLGSQGVRLIQTLGVVPARLVTQWQNPSVWLTLITAMYLHGGWGHLIGNMLYLGIFGNNVEDRMGHTRFFIFYTLCGIIAALAQVAVDPSVRIPTIGASGAIAGVLSAYLLLYPRARITFLVPLFIFFTTLHLPASIALAGWFLIQFLYGFMGLGMSMGGGGVAWWAHIGGFVVGLLLTRAFVKKRRPPPRNPYNDVRYWVNNDRW